MITELENIQTEKPIIKRPLILKITATIFLIVTLIIILLLYLSVNEYKQSMYDQLLKKSNINLSSIVNQIQEQITIRVMSNKPREIKQIYLSSLFEKATKNDKAIVFLLFSNNISEEDFFYPQENSKYQKILKEEDLKKEKIYGRYDDNMELILFSMPVFDNRNNFHGSIIMCVSPEFIVNGIKRTIKKAIILGYFMILVGLGLSLLLSKIILLPIKELENTAYSITAGDLSLRVKIKSTDEIAGLSYAFNVMTESLKNKIDDLNAIQLMSRNINANLSQEDLVNQIVKTFYEITNASHCTLLLQDPEYPEYFSTQAGIGVITDTKCYIPKCDGFLCKMLSSGKITVIDTLKEMFIEYALFFDTENQNIPKYNFIGIPFKYSNKIIGILYATGPKLKIKKSDIELYEILADSATIAIENAKLYTLAITDGLTGVFLKRHYLYKLDQEIEKAEQTGAPLSLIMTDIDFFKKVNDTFGHREGDIILKGVSEILKHCVRRKDIKRADREPDIIGRYGGEEFSILFLNAGADAIEMLAERVRYAIENTPIQGEKQVHHITVSIGACVFQKGMTKEALIENADMALYESKRNGRNRCTIWKG
ncbi:MAG TPA: diguanylate cyclase [bacterium]|nr:diguanylate cyclase [bacterium]